MEYAKKARLRAVLQITSAQQHAPIHFILPHLKLNRTGGSTHWRIKYKTRSIRSTKSDGLTTTGLHNSESSKGQIDQHKFPAGRKSVFRCNVEEILKRQLIVRSWAFATFSTTEKAFPGRKKMSRGP